jgi:hypothetical protein
MDRQDRDRRDRGHHHRGRQECRCRGAGLGAAGSGGGYLNATSKSWARDLIRLVNAHDRGRIGPWVIADELAKLNYKAYEHLKATDDPRTKDTVGPDCIVVWRYKKNTTLRPGFAGAEQNYTGTTRIVGGASIPIISYGRDMTALTNTMAAFDESGGETIGEQLRRLPDKPDEHLR